MVNNAQVIVLFGRYLKTYVKGLVPGRNVLPVLGEGRAVSTPDCIYEDKYCFWPPPVSMVLISVIQIILFSIDMVKYERTLANGPIAKALMYNPHKRYQAWRYVTYMFVHVGYIHLCVNLIVQIMLGIPLEMVHKAWRVLIIYFAGIIAGSLGTSITDPTVLLAGSSGGAYSLVTAHIAAVIMNWKQMYFPLLQILIFLVVTVVDLGTIIYNRCFLEAKDDIAFGAHIAGALSGLLVGIFILRNLQDNSNEKKLWWMSLVVYLGLLVTAIVWNVAYPEYFPPQY